MFVSIQQDYCCVTSIRGIRNKMAFGERRSFGSGPREMHKATCADCGNECEVPFKPAEGRPVYCQDCYKKHRKF